MSSTEDRNSHSLPDKDMDVLNSRQREIYSTKLARFAEYLKEEGKEPKRQIGYSEKTVSERVSRFHRCVRWLWSHHPPQTEITANEIDKINEAIECDDFCRGDGEPYAAGSKRKLNDVLRNWAQFQNIDWKPEYEFTDDRPERENTPDPFTKDELVQLWEVSLTYKSIPSYNNLKPKERDQWKSHIAQELGKPKDEVIPDDWERINYDWHVPSLIRTTRSQGWRPELIARLKVDWYSSETQEIHIPAGKTPKNEEQWTATLTDEGAHALEKWLEQRKLMDLYDESQLIWLTREGNPYSSGSLNYLLRDLMEEAGISSRGRKLVWYSFRHSIGTYVFAETTSLKAVAEQLRQTSLNSAEQYVHPLPELKRELSELM